MKPEIPLKSGDEQDALTRFRHIACVFFNNTGLVKWTQRKYWKRVRQHTKKVIAQQNLPSAEDVRGILKGKDGKDE